MERARPLNIYMREGTRLNPWPITCRNQGSCPGWNSCKSDRCACTCTYIHSQGLSHLSSTSINQQFLPYLSLGSEPGSLGIFVEEAFIEIFFTTAYLKCHLQVCRPRKRNFGRTTKCNVALLRLLTIHQPASRCDPILFSRWWNDDPMLINDLPSFPPFWCTIC